MQEKKERYWFIDGIRGFAIVNMVLFHFFYDYYMIYGKNTAWYFAPQIRFWQQSICWTFIFIAGFVWQLGKKGNLKRGLFLNFCGLLVTLVTWLSAPKNAAWFGILNFMGCAILLMLLFHKLLIKIEVHVGMVVSFCCFLFFKNIDMGYLGIGDIVLFKLPRWLYDIKLLTPLGFPYPGFVSSDYFPIFPWFFLFLTGYYFYVIFKEKTKWHSLACKPVPILSKIGTKSIWIYLLHQPLAMLLCEVLI